MSSYIEKTPAGVIDWKAEALRTARLLADAERIIAEYKARAIEAARQPPVYGAMEAALEMGQPGVERMVAAVAQTPDDATKMVYVKRWRTLVKLPAKYADEIVEALRIPDVAQTPPDQFMDDYKRDTTNAMAARILELEALLSAAQAPPRKD